MNDPCPEQTVLNGRSFWFIISTGLKKEIGRVRGTMTCTDRGGQPIFRPHFHGHLNNPSQNEIFRLEKKIFFPYVD